MFPIPLDYRQVRTGFIKKLALRDGKSSGLVFLKNRKLTFGETFVENQRRMGKHVLVISYLEKDWYTP